MTPSMSPSRGRRSKSGCRGASFGWRLLFLGSALWTVSGPPGSTREGMDMPWQVEGVNFSSRGNAGEEVVSQLCSFLDKYSPLLWRSFSKSPGSHVQGSPGRGAPLFPTGGAGHGDPKRGETTTEKMSRMTDSGSSKKRFLSLADFPPPREEQPSSSTACMLTSQQPGGQSWKCPVAQHGVGLLLPKQPASETLSHCLQAGEQAMKNPKQCQKEESEVPGRGPTQTSPIKTGANRTTETQGMWELN